MYKNKKSNLSVLYKLLSTIKRILVTIEVVIHAQTCYHKKQKINTQCSRDILLTKATL